MKKIVSIMVAGGLIVSALTGCSNVSDIYTMDEIAVENEPTAPAIVKVPTIKVTPPTVKNITTEPTETYYHINMENDAEKIVLTDLKLTRMNLEANKKIPVRVYQVTDRNAFYQIHESSYVVIDNNNSNGTREVYDTTPVNNVDLSNLNITKNDIDALFIYESTIDNSIKVLAGQRTE